MPIASIWNLPLLPWVILLDNFGQPAEAQSINVDKYFKEAEWITIFFFVGLFIIVAGVEHSDILDLLAEEMLHIVGEL